MQGAARSPILVAEDHEINQMLMSASLVSHGREPVVVGDGEAAVAAVMEAEARGEPFAMVFMDLQMPLMDGCSAARRIRAEGLSAAKLPIIALTASPVEEVAADCSAAGMQAALTKPLPMHELGRLVDQWTGTEAFELPPSAQAWAAARGALYEQLETLIGACCDFRERARRLEQALADWLEAAGPGGRSAFTQLARRVAYELPAATRSEEVDALARDLLDALKSD